MGECLNGVFNEYFSLADIHGFHLKKVQFLRWKHLSSLTHSSLSELGDLRECATRHSFSLLMVSCSSLNSDFQKSVDIKFIPIVKLRLYLEFPGFRKSGSKACFMCVLVTGANEIGINQE